MRKFIKVLWMSFLALLLVACQSDQAEVETKVFTNPQANGTEMTFEYQPDDGEIISQTSTFSVNYADVGISSKEQAQDSLSQDSQDLMGLSGVEYTEDFQDDKVTITMKITFDQLKEEEVTSIPSLADLTLVTQKMDQVEANLLSQGFELAE